MTINITSISGQHLFQESGAVVLISGQHVYVESGVHVVADIHVEVSSGLWVDGISGQPILVGYCIGPKGAYIPTPLLTDCSGQLFVWVSGQHVYVESGVHTIPSSGQNVVVESGLGVLVSGQHVFVESGTHVNISGQHVHLESGDTINVYVISGSEVHLTPSSDVMLTDQSGNIAAISKRHEGLVVTTDITREVHKGEMFYYSHLHSGLASMGVCDTLIFVASGREMHANFGAMAGASFHTFLYENPTCSDSGTPQLGCATPNCMNRNISGTCGTLFSEDPTVTNVGCELFVGVGGTATGPGGKGGGAGSIRQDTEWILNGASGMAEYLFRITNTDDAAKDVAKAVEFTEEDPLYW